MVAATLENSAPKAATASPPAETMKELPTAVQWYVELAEKGDADAQYNLGTIYETGFGVPIDERKAAAWYKKAANQEHRDAQLKLGLLYVLGKGTRQSEIKGARWVRKAADNGSSVAKLLYDQVLSPDIEAPLDSSDIVKKIYKVLDKGDAQAEKELVALIDENKAKLQQDKKPPSERFTGPSTNTLGEKIEIKNNVPEFLVNKEAQSPKPKVDNLSLLQRDANAGKPEAQYQLALLYESGDKVDLNPGEAIRWYTSAANKGLKEAQYRLGIAYLHGSGVPQNIIKGKEYLSKAADQNYDLANKLLPIYLGNAKEPSIVLSWFLEKALEGDADAQYGLGHIYENGWGVPADPVNAKKWYVSARSMGNDDADKRLRNIKAELAGQDSDQPAETRPKISDPKILKRLNEQKNSAVDSEVTRSKIIRDSDQQNGTQLNSASNDQTTTELARVESTNGVKSDAAKGEIGATAGAQKKKLEKSSTPPNSRKSVIIPALLVVFGIVLGVIVFKWMRNSGAAVPYKKDSMF
jgi:TPR repeat protein